MIKENDAMTAPKSVYPADCLREQAETASPDRLRAMVKTLRRRADERRGGCHLRGTVRAAQRGTHELPQRHLRLIRRHERGVVHTAYRTARLIWETLTYRGWGLPHAIIRDIPLPAGFGHENWPADARDPVHAAANYPEVLILTQLLIAPHWRPFAMSISTTDHDRFRAEFQHRLPPAQRDLANTDLQLLATVRHSPVFQWHQPPAETVTQQPTESTLTVQPADFGNLPT
jgi:hypothetical protein